jgi:hypothetical protein
MFRVASLMQEQRLNIRVDSGHFRLSLMAGSPALPENGNTFIQHGGLKMDVRRDNPKSRPTLSSNDARQGVSGQNVRYVLIFGTGSVIILFALIYFFYFAH